MSLIVSAYLSQSYEISKFITNVEIKYIKMYDNISCVLKYLNMSPKYSNTLNAYVT